MHDQHVVAIKHSLETEQSPVIHRIPSSVYANNFEGANFLDQIRVDSELGLQLFQAITILEMIRDGFLTVANLVEGEKCFDKGSGGLEIRSGSISLSEGVSRRRWSWKQL